MRRLARLLKYVWAAPITAFGLLLVAVTWSRSAQLRRRDGTLEVCSPRLRALFTAPWLGGGQFLAVTIGHVILGRDQPTLARCRAHERAHVAQVERWGLLFPLCYLGAAVIAKLKGGHAYWDNAFEQQARRAEHSR